MNYKYTTIILLACLCLPIMLQASDESKDKSISRSDGIKYGDVLMRSLRVWPKDENDPHDTLATAKAFKVDKIVWIYENTEEFNDKVRAAGIGIGTTMADNTRETWVGKLTPSKAEEFAAKYSIRNLKGEQVIPAHFKHFAGNPYIDHFVPDMTIKDWADIYTNYVTGLYELGIDTIHRDDPASTSWAPRSGGTFTDSAVEYFRNYLQENFDSQKLKELGVDNIATFNVREHFLALGAPTDNTLWQWRGSPLMKIFLDALAKANIDFYKTVRSRVEKATGRSIPWSLNGTGPYTDIDRFFDFRIGEYQRHHNQPQTLLKMSEYAIEEGKMQALISMVDGDWNEHPEQFVRETRHHIATAYAAGMVPLVPWCMYMHQAPRYYGTVEDFGDLYYFVSENRKLLDDHCLVAASGIDTQANLYSWLPNKQLRYPDNTQRSLFWINKENVFAFLREDKASGSKVIHLVDWNDSPQSFELSFNPSDVAGFGAVDISILRYGKDTINIKNYAGASIQIPAISPWAMITIEPAKSADMPVAAPKLISPAFKVAAIGTKVVFDNDENQTIFWRFGSEDEFQQYNKQTAPTVEKPGILEAYSQEKVSGRKSGILRVDYDVYNDHSVEESVIASARPVKRLTNSFNCIKGEMKVNSSFLGGKLFMDGKPVTNGISTEGQALISCKADPSWKYFTVQVGLDDAEDRRPCARFQVWFDNNMAYETPILNPTKLILDEEERRVFPISLAIPQGTSQIRLVSVPSGFFADQNHIVWNEPTAYK